MKSKLIVGCGYLGHRVAGRWLANGDVVMALTRSIERAKQFQAEGMSPLIGDVVDPESLASVDEVSTLVYAVGFDRSAEHSKHDVYVNGLKRILDSVADAVEHFIYVSSISVYGQSHGEWIDEDSRCEPTTDGGRICLEAEQLIHDTFADKTARYNILRFAGIYGPGRLLRRVESLKCAEPIGGNPDAFLNLIHVDDGCDAVVACEEIGRANATYVISDGQGSTRRDYFRTLARLVDAPEPVFDASATPGSRPGNSGLNKRCCNNRMLSELEVEMSYPSIEDGLVQSLSE
jgi:nucleoside-diphosphate-sugar epimerase